MVTAPTQTRGTVQWNFYSLKTHCKCFCWLIKFDKIYCNMGTIHRFITVLACQSHSISLAHFSSHVPCPALCPSICTHTQCLDPFVSVNTSSDPHVKCSLDSDGDRIPDHLVHDTGCMLRVAPHTYVCTVICTYCVYTTISNKIVCFRMQSLSGTTQRCQHKRAAWVSTCTGTSMQGSVFHRQEVCNGFIFSASLEQSCPVDTTSSPDISWSETRPCVYDVQRCSTLLNETVGE